MSLIYNEETFQKYRALAITRIDDIKIGQTYWTNSRGMIVVVSLLTNREAYAANGLKWTGEDADEVAWIKYDGDGFNRVMALSDDNIGTSYNPWLIFESADVAKACMSELHIGFVCDDFDYFDEYYDSYDSDYDVE